MSLIKLTPNCMVANMEKTLEFYTSILGFETTMSFPENGIPEWVTLQSGGVELMFQTRSSLEKDLPVFSGIQIGSSSNLFFIVTGINKLYVDTKEKVEVVMEIQDRFYGMREFSIKDPDGYVITFAEEIKQES